MFKKARYQKCVLDHKDRVFRYAYYTLRDAADAEDATQEVFIKLWKHFDEVQVLKVKAWLMRTTYNQCIDMIRKRQRTRNREVEIQDYQDFDLDVPVAADPSDRMECQSLGQRIEAAVATLPEKVRSIFLMYEMQGLKYREIADATGIPINTVKVHLMRARKTLQEELKYERSF
jgi:RNA polymerase sigma-70 factor, ECF subfamily